MKSETNSFALQKSLYCNAKVPVLPRKTGTFTMQNNGYYNVLKVRQLHKNGDCEISLHIFYIFKNYK